MLSIITSEDCLKRKWFNFGYELGLKLHKLDNIEIRYHGPIQCTSELLFVLSSHYCHCFSSFNNYEELDTTFTEVALHNDTRVLAVQF